MNRTYRITPVYTGDVSGVCSALFELGGMVVIHDPSGCNSTYNTHDETRWYDHDSLIFISGLAEIDAILGNDEKFISDVVDAALELRPKFITLVNSPVPYLNGTDFSAISRIVEQQTGIPTFYIPTNGMHDYVVGAGAALAEIARRFVSEPERVRPNTVNLLGVTPLEYTHSDAPASLRRAVETAGLEVLSCWAMGNTLEQLGRASEAAVNLVVSAVGLEAAKVLQSRFGTPYVVGAPIGAFRAPLLDALKAGTQPPDLRGSADADWCVIGEPVTMGSLAAAIQMETGHPVRLLCPLERCEELLSPGDLTTVGEEDLENVLKSAKVVLADPLYRPICPPGAKLISIPHEAFSGRCHWKTMRNIVDLNIPSLLKEAEV